MRTAIRRIFVTCSTLLLLATVALWGRSGFASDYVSCRLWRGDAPDAPTRTLLALGYWHGPVWHYRSVTFDVNDAALAALYAADRSADPRWAHFAMPRAGYDPLGPADFETFATWSGGGFVFHSGTRAAPSANRWGETINGRTYWYATITHRTVGVPWWFLAALFAIAPGRAAWRWRRSRRYPPHACPACGYDLRATPDAAGPRLSTCPECGRAT